MKIPYYHIDAFTGKTFSGNPAGVCLLDDWLPDGVLQGIAAENNLSETAFVVAKGDHFELRWFTPKVEVDLCGHATLAAAFVIFKYLGYTGSSIRFQSKSGLLTVERDKELIILDFPARPPVPCPTPQLLVQGLGCRPIEVRRSRDYFAVFSAQEDIPEIKPDMLILSQLDCLGIIATAPGNAVDFVSRFFAPGAGIPEDPVTGSAHCSLIPYWSERLGKQKMTALQLSTRGGELFCEYAGDRVKIGGKAVVYLKGEIEIRD
ncbi:MAG: PhzF family phenazine biosynthesis protein [Candidatus Auribacterota bacterium]